MSAVDDLAVIIKLACVVEDRSDAEQDALLRAAASIDRKRNQLGRLGSQHSTAASRLYDLVADTRDPQSGSQRANPLISEALEAGARRWEAYRAVRIR